MTLIKTRVVYKYESQYQECAKSKLEKLLDAPSCACAAVVAIWFAECNCAVRFTEREVLRSSVRTKSAVVARRIHEQWRWRVVASRFWRGFCGGRAHCHTDRSTRLFHLRRLRISFTVQARVHTYTFSYSTRAAKRGNINHSANIRNCPPGCSVAQSGTSTGWTSGA